MNLFTYIKQAQTDPEKEDKLLGILAVICFLLPWALFGIFHFGGFGTNLIVSYVFMLIVYGIVDVIFRFNKKVTLRKLKKK